MATTTTAKEGEKVSLWGVGKPFLVLFFFLSSCARWSRRTLTEGDVVVVVVKP